jgi:hypothetical protein
MWVFPPCGQRQIERSLHPGRPLSFLVAALSSVERDVCPAETPPGATRHGLCTLVQTLTAVVLGSIGIMVAPVRVSAGPEANQLTAAWFTAWVA